MTRKSFFSIAPGEASSLDADKTETIKKALSRTRMRMGRFFKKNQFLGRKASIGCVSLEISQRCNLDCSLCYLSPSSSQVTDLPLREVFRRLEEIQAHFGVGANVQISGGDPTMRDRNELVQIVRHARRLGLHPALVTNGIRCSRSLLEMLVENGLSDVAFHVDLTQGRKGFQTEAQLNAVRREYIERARGLPLMVIFNTTVHHANFHEIPDLVRFFIEHADVVGFASFQLQADTGRGVLGKRPDAISLESVKRKIDSGSGSGLAWDAVLVGHPKCHSYAPAWTINHKAVPLVDDAELVAAFLHDFQHVTHDRRQSSATIAWQYLKEILRRPRWIVRGLQYILPRLWKLRRDLIAARGRTHMLSFFVQNFMNAENLDPERIEACSFMVMTPDGPVSMCAHNARRDDYILRPIEVPGEHGTTLFHPIQAGKGSATDKALAEAGPL